MQLMGQHKAYRCAKGLADLLKQCFNKNEYAHPLPNEQWAAKWIRTATAGSLDGFSSSKTSVEASRQNWLTEANLRTWATKEEEFALQMKLMEHNGEGKVCWKEGVADRIVNFDETSISVDTSEMSCGGRPIVYFLDPDGPDCGIARSKSSFRCTLAIAITASDF